MKIKYKLNNKIIFNFINKNIYKECSQITYMLKLKQHYKFKNSYNFHIIFKRNII